MPTGNRRPLYSADDVPAVDVEQQSMQAVQLQPLSPAPSVIPIDSGSTFKQPCTLKGLTAAFYAGALGYFLGFIPATIKFKAKQWGMIHNQGMASASQLALMSGMYTAVHCICQRIRMVEDGWNRGIAGCSTGLVLGWKTGPWGALQSCASLGLLSALIDFGGGAVEAAEAAMLHQLQEIQAQHQQQQPSWAPTWPPQHKHQHVVGQLLNLVADPCSAIAHMQQMQKYRHSVQEAMQSTNSSSSNSCHHQGPQVAGHHLGLQTSVAAAVQQVQQLVAAPPLMFLGACCHGTSSIGGNTAAATAGPELEACEVRAQQAATGAHRSKKLH